MTTKMAFVKVLAMTFVSVRAVAIALIGIPRASGDPPVDPGGGSAPGGGGGPPGGTAGAPGGVSDDDGLWSATVGGTEFDGLDSGDVGKLLWRGRKVSATILGDDGVSRTVQVCEEFPQVNLQSQTSGPGSSTNEASVDFDLNRCTVTLSELTRTTTGVPSDESPSGPGVRRSTLQFSGEEPRGVPIVWTAEQAEPTGIRFGPPSCTSPLPDPTRSSQIRGQILALAGWAGALTEVTMDRCYTANRMRTTLLNLDCLTGSPARVVQWHEDECRSGRRDTSTSVRSWARGRFHASWLPVIVRMVGSTTRHTVNLTLEGTAIRESHSCTVDPSSIKRLQLWIFVPGLPLPQVHTVKFKCSYSTVFR